MRIGVDIRPAAEPERRGVGQYTVEVLARMITRFGADDDWRLLCLGARPDCIPSSLLSRNAHLQHRRVGKLSVHHVAARATRRWDDRALQPLDVFFVPSAHLLALSPETPVVATVHDAFFATQRQTMSWRERSWHALADPGSLYQRADRLVANSATTARELVSVMPELEGRISVVPLGISEVYRRSVHEEEIEQVRARLSLPDRYLLFLSAIDPRKNVARLLEAFAIAKRAGLDHDLVIAGGMTPEGHKVLDSGLLNGVHVLGFVRELDKPALYSGCTAFVLPSLDEGFGFPPLEALACGRPSLVSNIPIFEETLGDAALTCSPFDVDDIAQGLLRLAGDPSLCEELVGKGQHLLPKFDWSACARRTYDVLQESASSRV